MNGRPLKVSGKTVYSRSGKVVGRIIGNKVYGNDGRYVGTVTSGRLVYRSTDSAGVSTPFSAANRSGSARRGQVVFRAGQNPTLAIVGIGAHQKGRARHSQNGDRSQAAINGLPGEAHFAEVANQHDG